MELVIDIPKDVKNRLASGITYETYEQDIQILCEAIRNSIPLSEHRGRLVVADEANGYFLYC